MKVLGVKCSKSGLAWMVLEGSARRDAAVAAYDQADAPPKAKRPETLAWARKELLEVVEKHHPDAVALRATEGQGGSFERAEMDGVVQASLFELDIPVHRMKAVTIRSKFKARDNAALEVAGSKLPALADQTSKARRELFLTAAGIFSE